MPRVEAIIRLGCITLGEARRRPDFRRRESLQRLAIVGVPAPLAVGTGSPLAAILPALTRQQLHGVSSEYTMIFVERDRRRSLNWEFDRAVRVLCACGSAVHYPRLPRILGLALLLALGCLEVVLRAGSN